MGEDSASCTKLNIPTRRVQISQGPALDITRRGLPLAGWLSIGRLVIRRADVQLWTNRAATKVYRGRVTIA